MLSDELSVAGEEARGGCKFIRKIVQGSAGDKVQQHNSVLECTRWICEFGPEDLQRDDADLLPEAGVRLRAESKKVRAFVWAVTF